MPPHDISTIVRSEIALAKAEITGDAKNAGRGAGMFAGAAFVALLGLIFLFHTVAAVIDIWLPLVGRLPHHDRDLLFVAGCHPRDRRQERA